MRIIKIIPIIIKNSHRIRGLGTSKILFLYVKLVFEQFGKYKKMSMRSIFIKPASYTNTYSEPCETSKKELFAKIVNSRNPLTIFEKGPVLNV